MIQSKVEKVSLYSKILGKDVQMWVYLPEGYNEITPLPVLYFLHGRSSDENIMFKLEINTKADGMTSAGAIEPMIIVCPRIENSLGLNSSLTSKEVPDSGYGNGIINLGRYEDYFMDEVVPLIDNTLNTIKDRNGMYVGGASASGYAVLHYAFRYQDMFSKVEEHIEG